MNLRAAVVATIFSLAAVGAFAATPRPISVDRSGSFLIDTETAEALWKKNTSARLLKLYPPRRFRFVSEVGGGFNEAKMCIVNARAMLLPVKTRTVVYAPVETATAFDAQANLSDAQCQELARTKLAEAIVAVEAALLR